MQGSFITLPGSTSLAKADTKTSHYHNHSGPRWNPFTEYTFYFALDFYWPLHLSKNSMMNNYKYQNETMVGFADEALAALALDRLVSSFPHKAHSDPVPVLRALPASSHLILQ